MSQGLVKGHAGCGLRPGSAPDAALTLEDMRRDLDAWGAAPDTGSPSAPLQDHERDMEPEHPLGFSGGMRDFTLPPLQNLGPPDSNDGEDSQYLPKRFENAIGGITAEDPRDYRWVPPPPFSPMKPRAYENDVTYGTVGQPGSRSGIDDTSSYGTHPPLASPTTNRFDPSRSMRPPAPMHNSSGSYSSMPDTNSGSHDTSSFPTPDSLPPLQHLLFAHDRGRSDPFNASPAGGSSTASSYGGSSNARNAPVYSQPLPTMSPGHHAPYSHPKGVVPGYPQQQVAGYGLASDPGTGHSSGTSSP